MVVLLTSWIESCTDPQRTLTPVVCCWPCLDHLKTNCRILIYWCFSQLVVHKSRLGTSILNLSCWYLCTYLVLPVKLLLQDYQKTTYPCAFQTISGTWRCVCSENRRRMFRLESPWLKRQKDPRSTSFYCSLTNHPSCTKCVPMQGLLHLIYRPIVPHNTQSLYLSNHFILFALTYFCLRLVTVEGKTDTVTHVAQNR